jgi:mannan endo-1,4-beta-mannosidase
VKQSILWAVLFPLFVALAARAQTQVFQAELGTFGGTVVSTNRPGYTGTGYVSFENETGQYVQVQASVPDGLYELWLGYNSPHGFKGYDFVVDGVTGSGGFDQTGTNQWSTDRAGVFALTGETNSLRINRGWGWYNVDRFELRPFTPPALQAIPAQLVDEQAAPYTQMLMNYLVSQYGQKTLSGLQHNSSDNLSFPVQSYVNQAGGKVPAIRGSDLIDYSPSRVAFGENPQNETEQTIAWAKQTGGIVTVMWHWNAPANLINQPGNEWWRGFYSDATTFDLPGALANPAGGDYQLLLSDIDAIAVELQKYENEGIPVIWRPLHEAQGEWFWWGDHGPEAFKQLWHLMHDRLTNHHGLHNLIWEFTSFTDGDHLDWYPGDDEVDMIGLDVYTDPSSNMNGQWYDVLEHYNGRKLLAVSETDTLVNPDTMDLWSTDWSYVAPWAWDYVMSEYANAGYSPAQLAAILQQFLNHEKIITLDELPTLPWSNDAPELTGDYNADGTVDAVDYTVWRNALGNPAAGLAADGNGDGIVDDADYAVWKLYYGQSSSGAGGLANVPEPSSELLGVSVLIAILARRGTLPPKR